jgi:hypothetical protein
MIRLDIKYARELSFWLDLKIIFSTLPCLLAQVRDSRRARESPSAADHRRPAEMPDGVLSNGLGRPAVAPANDRPAS